MFPSDKESRYKIKSLLKNMLDNTKVNNYKKKYIYGKI